MRDRLYTATAFNRSAAIEATMAVEGRKPRYHLRAGRHPNKVAGRPLMDEPDQEIFDYIDYDPITGEFSWIKPRKGVRVGELAGWYDPDGYRRIVFARRNYAAHRLAWYYSTGNWPELTVDHRNGKRDDNRIANLRLATRQEQAANSVSRSVLPRGVHRTASGKFSARICVGRKGRHLGCFATPEQAYERYKLEAEKQFGAFAHHLSVLPLAEVNTAHKNSEAQ